MVPPKGPSLAFSTSTWIHWWSPVASANWSTRSWVISTQSVVPISSPAADSISSNELNTRMDDAPRGSGTDPRPRSGCWMATVPNDSVQAVGGGEPISLTPEVVRAAPKVLLHDHLDGGLRPQTIVELAQRGRAHAAGRRRRVARAVVHRVRGQRLAGALPRDLRPHRGGDAARRPHHQGGPRVRRGPGSRRRRLRRGQVRPRAAPAEWPHPRGGRPRGAARLRRGDGDHRASTYGSC